jgi:hypothetical protein
MATKQQQQQPRFDWEVVARFLCEHHNVSDVSEIDPFRGRVPCWKLMTAVVLDASFGSVKGERGGEERRRFQFRLDPEDSAEQQAVTCRLDPADSNTMLLSSAMPRPETWFEHPTRRNADGSPVRLQPDLGRVYPYSIVFKHVWNSVPIEPVMRLTFYHRGANELHDLERADRAWAAAGGVRGAFYAIRSPTSPEGDDVNVVPLPEHGFGCQNPHFVRTMALVTEQNIHNGVVTIPHNVCLAARLPVFRGPPQVPDNVIERLFQKMTLAEGAAEPDAVVKKEFRERIERQNEEYWAKVREQGQGREIREFKAVPVNHVLAWILHSEDYAAQGRWRYEQFRYVPPANVDMPSHDPVLLYFLVGDYYYDRMVEFVRARWMTKVDARPLASMGVEFVPRLGRALYPKIPAEAQVVTGYMAATACFKYMVAPALSPTTVANLAPELAPGFPHCQDWNVDDVARQMAIERHMEKMAELEKK